MPREIEAKFKVADFTAVRRALRKAGAKYLATVRQSDEFFDTPDHRLRNGDRGLRIRTVRVLRSGGEKPSTRPLVTYKGPRRPGRAVKSRPEVQTHADDAEAMRTILRACGLQPVWYQDNVD